MKILLFGASLSLVFLSGCTHGANSRHKADATPEQTNWQLVSGSLPDRGSDGYGQAMTTFVLLNTNTGETYYLDDWRADTGAFSWRWEKIRDMP